MRPDRNPQPLRVLLTVDAEIWPYKRGWPAARLTDEDLGLTRQFEHCILGAAQDGEFGLPYQMATLNKHGLRATFFVESLHAAAAGDRWLVETVRMIRTAGHDVQLHAHTEWLSEAKDAALAGSTRQFFRDYALEDQVRILSLAKNLLEASGAPVPVAFRAGNFGANVATLRALRRIGVSFDSSANSACADSLIDADQPALVEGVMEVPITVFHDFGLHRRPAQIAACSAQELEHALWEARGAGRRTFVLVWHGCELLESWPGWARRARSSPIMLRRFSRLCSFLAEHRRDFETVVFSELDLEHLAPHPADRPLKSQLRLTAHRMFEQALKRFY